MGCRQRLLNPQQIDAWGRGRRAEALPGNLAGKCMVLQVEKAGCSLDVGHGFGPAVLQPLEDLARRQSPFELADELFQMVLHDAVEIDQFAVDIVQYLDQR